jgi:hypothetical protein
VHDCDTHGRQAACTVEADDSSAGALRCDRWRRGHEPIATTPTDQGRPFRLDGHVRRLWTALNDRFAHALLAAHQDQSEPSHGTAIDRLGDEINFVKIR